jgi:hypothetical protein
MPKRKRVRKPKSIISTCGACAECHEDALGIRHICCNWSFELEDKSIDWLKRAIAWVEDENK